ASHQLEKALAVQGADVPWISPTVFELVASVASTAIDGARYARGAHADGARLADRQRPIFLIDDLQRHMGQHAADPRRSPLNVGAVQHGHAPCEARRVALDKMPAERCPRPAFLIRKDGSAKAVKRVKTWEETGSAPRRRLEQSTQDRRHHGKRGCASGVDRL